MAEIREVSSRAGEIAAHTESITRDLANPQAPEPRHPLRYDSQRAVMKPKRSSGASAPTSRDLNNIQTGRKKPRVWVFHTARKCTSLAIVSEQAIIWPT